MTTREQIDAAGEARAAWLAEQLAKAPPLTAEQQRELRRVLLPPKPIRKPA